MWASSSWALLCALLVVLSAWAPRASLAQTTDPPRVSVPAGATWSLLAWGWNNGGQDSTAGAQVVIVDMDTDAARIPTLRAEGRTVICYISTGTLEPFRDDTQANQARWREAAVGAMQQWDEEWLDITKLDILAELMVPRFDRALALGCQGIEPDNVDCYDNSECYSRIVSTGGSKNAARAAQVVYNTWQVDAAHERGLVIGLKNSLDLVDEMGSLYDFAVNEQCQQYQECGLLEPFVDEGKAVFHVEYSLGSNRCAQAAQFSTSTKYCDGSNSAGICRSGSWINCFGNAPVEPTPQPVAAPTAPVPPTTNKPTPQPTPFPSPVPPSPPAPTPQPTLVTLPPTQPGGSVPGGITWANLAWGWSDGGEDSAAGVQALLVDLDFYPDAELAAARARGQLVICYFSGGTAESFRPDVQTAPAAWSAASIARMSKWPEDWLDISDLAAMDSLMTPRLARAKQRGCDGVEPDNVDCASNAECRAALPNPAAAGATQVAYNRWLANKAHDAGLLVALKNCAEFVPDLVDHFDMSVVESCQRWGTCAQFGPFRERNKAVWAVEYELAGSAATQCSAATAAGLMLKVCDGSAASGLCTAGAWVDCFERAGGGVLEPLPPPSKVWMPGSPVAWANLGGFAGANASAAGAARDGPDGSQLVIVDLHDAASRAPNAALVRELVSRGHHVLCSFSAGAQETWRPDAGELADAVVGNNAKNRQGHVWLNVGDADTVAAVRRVVSHRIDLAAALGCHGVDPRDVDCYETKSCRQGWGLSGMGQRNRAKPYQTEFNAWLAARATARGLLVAHHATPSLATSLLDVFDFAIAEACIARQNCHQFAPFLDANKPVLNLEFTLGASTCNDTVDVGVDTKMCDGKLSDRACKADTSWENCFAAVEVTAWPTAAPTRLDAGDGMTMWMWMAVIVGAPTGALALIVGALRRRRRKQLLLLAGGADGVRRHPATVGGVALYGGAQQPRGASVNVRSWFDVGRGGQQDMLAKAPPPPPAPPRPQQQQQQWQRQQRHPVLATGAAPAAPVSYSAWLRETALGGSQASWAEFADGGGEIGGAAQPAAQTKGRSGLGRLRFW